MKKKITVILPIAGLMFAAAGWGREGGQAAAKAQSPDRFAKVRSLILEALNSGGAPSISVAAAVGGKVVWEESFGFANREKGIPATPDTLYALASISKSITATGLMVLAERKLIDLDRPVNDYLGEAKLTVHAGDPRRVTVRRLLLMEAGMPMHWNIFRTREEGRPPSQDESIRRYGIVVNDQSLEYVYSNFAYGVLDRVISRVAGESYGEFMKNEVFLPLGLSRTSVHIDPELASAAAQNYDAKGNAVPPLEYDHDGASAVYSSVHDLIRYGMFHMKTGVSSRKPVLRPGSLDLLHRPSALDASASSLIGNARMSMGWGILDLAGVRFVIASGAAPGTISRLAFIPEKEMAVAVLCNASLADEFSIWKIEWETFAALIPGFPERPAIPAGKPSPFRPPQALVGEWHGSAHTYQGAVPLSLSIGSDGQASVTLDGRAGGPVPLDTPLGPLAFRDGWFSGLFFGSVPTDDARRSPHVVFLRLRLRGENLTGTVSAVAVDQSFALPHWASLERKSAPVVASGEAAEAEAARPGGPGTKED